MRIVFLSNYFNHHQSALSEQLDLLTDGQYHFIATGEMREDRKQLGYGQGAVPSYVLQYDADPQTAERLLLEADVSLIGSAPAHLVQKRKQTRKLTFLVQERPFKHEVGAAGIALRTVWYVWKHRRFPMVYLLCASAFCAADYARTCTFLRKAYRWGYFAELRRHSGKAAADGKQRTSILWAGRLLDWKHPEHAVLAAERLRGWGCHFRLDLIGTGPMEDALREMIQAKGLSDCVRLLGPMPPDAVRDHMESAGIFLFTSNREEGWGVVLNEAMNSGCAVIAGHEIGAVPYLLAHGENGLVYRSGDWEQLAEHIRCLLKEPETQSRLGAAAYQTISEMWNAEIAAQRLLALSRSILDGQRHPNLFDHGPCSRADVILEDWFKV